MQGDGEVFGTIYLDMLRRPNKFQNAAHFNIRSGRRLSDGGYQSPVVALVCNFASSACLTLR
jgi:Zn-dependent oligopeptidase